MVTVGVAPQLEPPVGAATAAAIRDRVLGLGLSAATARLLRRIGQAAVPAEAVTWTAQAGAMAPALAVPVMDPDPGVPVMAQVAAPGIDDAPDGPLPTGARDWPPGSGDPEPEAPSPDTAPPPRSAAAVGVLEAGSWAPAATAVRPTPPSTSPHKPPVVVDAQDLLVQRVRSTQAQRIGDEGERLAVLRLEALGWRILARNVRLGRAEVDVLAIDPSAPPMLVVVEVRSRSRRDFGLPEETVDQRKRAHLRHAAAELEARRVLPDGTRLPDLPVRIDLVAIDRGPGGLPSVRHHRGIEA